MSIGCWSGPEKPRVQPEHQAGDARLPTPMTSRHRHPGCVLVERGGNDERQCGSFARIGLPERVCSPAMTTSCATARVDLLHACAYQRGRRYCAVPRRQCRGWIVVAEMARRRETCRGLHGGDAFGKRQPIVGGGGGGVSKTVRCLGAGRKPASGSRQRSVESDARVKSMEADSFITATEARGDTARTRVQCQKP